MVETENKPKTTLQALRDRIARIEGHRPDRPAQAWAGGLARDLFDRAVPVGACHEVVAPRPAARGAATGFSLALGRALAGTVGRLLWIQVGVTAREVGRPYGPGLAAWGLDPDRVLLLATPAPRDALWAAEEALSTPRLGVVLLEIEGAPTALDATAVRRLKLRGEAAGVPGILLRHGSAVAEEDGLPVDLRWQVEPLPSAEAPRHLLGQPAFALHLVKNRFGRTGSLRQAWEAADARFVPLHGDSAAAIGHRPSGAAGEGGPLRRTG